jgi:hypothetical protein
MKPLSLETDQHPLSLQMVDDYEELNKHGHYEHRKVWTLK